MKVLVNISPEEQHLQGLLINSFSSYGFTGKGTTKTYDLGTLLDLARNVEAKAILVTNPRTLKGIVNDPKPSLDDWRGSVLNTSIPIVITNPLSHINTKATGKTLHTIDIEKLALVAKGSSSSYRYDYELCHNQIDLQQANQSLSQAAVLVLDIETNFHNQITSISFTPILHNWKIARTFVISLEPSHYKQEEDIYLAWQVVKSLCESDIVKVCHNGTFDCFHLLRYHIAVENYIYDTEYIWRCWHAELNKALDKIASYLLPDYYSWKHESSLSPLEYNAKDTINTARIFIHMLKHAPNWVWTNYAQIFPNIGPVLYTSFEGFLVDLDKLAEARDKSQQELDQELETLRSSIGIPHFNPGSHQQVSALFYGVLRAKKPSRAKSASATGELELKAVARQHPLFAYLVNKILKYRENKKAISTYYDAQLTNNNRLIYSLSLDGTETARMSCSASSLRTLKQGKRTYVKTNMRNYGTQLQNIPPYHKKALKADPGYLLGNVDKSQSEARCVGYVSSCPSLVEALENPPEIKGVRDFYCYTGYRFFGIEFDKDHPLRQIVKKIIHGTNYIMGPQTFIDSVGVEELFKYKKILGYRGTLFDFAKYLLELYHTTYPEVREAWKKVSKEIAMTGKVITPDGWVRIVEGDIHKFNSILRELVAHRSQHWSVWGINRAFWKLYYELQVPSNGEYRLKGQIHDSIVYQAKKEKIEEYTRRTKEIMDIPQECEYGTMRIPLDENTGEYWKS